MPAPTTRNATAAGSPQCYRLANTRGSTMIILAGSIRIATGRREDAMDALSEMLQATLAENGCLAYSFAFDLLDEHLLRIFEVFQDEEALAAHRASPHMAAWRDALPLLGIGDRDMWQYDVSASRRI
jgi:quinol monooxygenase YgiN